MFQEPTTLAKIAGGVIWVAALLAALLSLDRLFQADFEDGSLDQLMLSKMALEQIVLAKAVAHWLTTGLPLVALAPILAVLLNLPTEAYFWLIASLALGTPALSAIGTFGAALTVGLRRGGLLLSLLILPLYVPTLIFGTLAVHRAALGQSATTPFLLMTGITLATLALMPFAAAAALKVNLR